MVAAMSPAERKAHEIAEKERLKDLELGHEGAGSFNVISVDWQKRKLEQERKQREEERKQWEKDFSTFFLSFFFFNVLSNFFNRSANPMMMILIYICIYLFLHRKL